MVNLADLAERLQDAGLLQKSFLDCTRSEILQVVSAVLSSIGKEVPPDGWGKPYLEEGTQRLIIPHDSHPKYRWWTDEGQCLFDTLVELDAPYEVAVRYVPRLTEEAWLNKLIPF
jgi:hypothetical protein